MPYPDAMLMPVARALCEHDGNRWPDGSVEGDWKQWDRRMVFLDAAEVAFDAVLAELRKLRLIVRDEHGVVHQLRGSPEDLWHLLIDGIGRE
jgi:hypothetical protein